MPRVPCGCCVCDNQAPSDHRCCCFLSAIENAALTVSLVITHSCVQLLPPPATRHVRAVKSAVAACRRRLRRPSLQHPTLPLLSPRHPRELFSHHSRAYTRSLASSCRRPHALLPGPAPSTAARAMPRAHCRGHVECSCSRRLPLQIKTMRIVCNDSLAADNKRCSAEAAFVSTFALALLSG